MFYGGCLEIPPYSRESIHKRHILRFAISSYAVTVGHHYVFRMSRLPRQHRLTKVFMAFFYCFF